MYRMEAVKVDTHLSGEIDCADLERKLTERKDKPAILNVNIGKSNLPPVALDDDLMCGLFTQFRSMTQPYP